MSARAAEFELKPRCESTGEAVLLGDVAQVHTADRDEARKLAAIELVPSPSPGRQRTLKLREVQDLLALNGVNLAEHQFSGSTTVLIGAGSSIKNASLTAKVAKRPAPQVNGQVQQAIAAYLEQQAAHASWQVAVEQLPSQAAETIGARVSELQVSGGEEPWTGTQEFEIAVRTAQGDQRVKVKAEVSLPDLIVVPRRPLRRGEIVQAADLDQQLPAKGTAIAASAVTRLEDVVGRETTRSVATGQAIDPAWLKKPVMVRRGEVVTVFARAGNVQVRTNAKALGDGGQGDVVAVERVDNRQRFTARVIGVQELEVLVSSVNVTSPQAPLPRVITKQAQSAGVAPSRRNGS